MKVFLTGATGYTGAVVRDHLVAAGHDLLCIARTAPGSGGEGYRWVEGSFEDGPLLRTLADSCEATIHIGASHDSEMERLDRIVVDAIADAYRGTGRTFITTSATPVYGDTGAHPRDEREPIEHPHPLRAWRAGHDTWVAALSAEGMRGVAIRPGYIYGRGGGLLARAIHRARETGDALYVGTGRYKSSSIHVDALAELYRIALERPDARGIYNAASDEIICEADIATAITALLAPSVTARTWPLEDARKTLGELADLIVIDCVVRSDRARAELGWAPNAPGLLTELITGSYRPLWQDGARRE